MSRIGLVDGERVDSGGKTISNASLVHKLRNALPTGKGSCFAGLARRF